MSLKIDSIPVLAGSINYPEWEQQIQRFLQSEDLYSHVEGDEDDPNAPWPASYPPVLPDNPTAARRTEFRNWWKDDARTMLIIERRITQVQLGLLPSEPGTTARICWNKLKNLYGRLDVHAQFALMDKVSSLRLKDYADCDRYLSEFSLADWHGLNSQKWVLTTWNFRLFTRLSRDFPCTVPGSVSPKSRTLMLANGFVQKPGRILRIVKSKTRFGKI